MRDIRVAINSVTFQIGDFDQGADVIIFLHFGSANLMV
jgi:hypothetical protein